MKKVWSFVALSVFLLGAFFIGSLSGFADEIEDAHAIYSAPIVKGATSGEGVEFTYSGTDENGVVWFSGDFPDTYVETFSVDSPAAKATLVPLSFHLGYQIVNRRVHMIAKADSPGVTNAKYYKLSGHHWSTVPKLMGYHSTTAGTKSITCGGRDMGEHKPGGYFIDTEGSAAGFNMKGSGAFYASANITVK